MGTGDSGNGAEVTIYAGTTTADTPTSGGFVRVSSGISTKSSSGDVYLRTANAGTSGVSGLMSYSTGTTSAGTSGMIKLETGTATGGKGGDVQLLVGTGNQGVGGDVLVYAGKTIDATKTGGAIKSKVPARGPRIEGKVIRPSASIRCSSLCTCSLSNRNSNF